MYYQVGTWSALLSAINAGARIFYLAPLDLHPRAVRIVKVYKNRKVRIDPMSNEADNFTADKAHLDRFRLLYTTEK